MVDLKVIRNNLNMIIIFIQNDHYTRKMYKDFIGSDMIFEKFENYIIDSGMKIMDFYL